MWLAILAVLKTPVVLPAVQYIVTEIGKTTWERLRGKLPNKLVTAIVLAAPTIVGTIPAITGSGTLTDILTGAAQGLLVGSGAAGLHGVFASRPDKKRHG